jgi:hypothetical protein
MQERLAGRALNGNHARVWRETTEAIERVAGLAADEILDTSATALYRLDRLAGFSNG